MISYAQNCEDVLIRRFFADKKNGFYIDVGAAHPVLDSVTKYFYERGWRGINVEPSPALYEKLSQSRVRDINIQCAVSKQPGEIVLFDYPNSGLSTVVENLSENVLTRKEQHDYFGVELSSAEVIRVPAKRLDSLLEEYLPVPEIDFLKIDVEGAEHEVLLSNDWTRFRPKLILVESTVPNSRLQSYEQWESILLDARFRFCYFDGLNRYYAAEEAEYPEDVFSSPPCVFDSFVPYRQWRAEQDAGRLEEELERKDGELLSERNRVAEAEKFGAGEKTLRIHFETLYNSVVNSRSWRMTRPLRAVMNGIRRFVGLPGRILKKCIVRTGRFLMRFTLIKKTGKKLLVFFPGLRRRIKVMLGLAMPSLPAAKSGSRDCFFSPRAEAVFHELQRALGNERRR